MFYCISTCTVISNAYLFASTTVRLLKHFINKPNWPELYNLQNLVEDLSPEGEGDAEEATMLATEEQWQLVYLRQSTTQSEMKTLWISCAGLFLLSSDPNRGFKNLDIEFGSAVVSNAIQQMSHSYKMNPCIAESWNTCYTSTSACTL